MHLFERVTYRSIRILAGLGTTAVFGFNTIPHVLPTKTIEASRGIPNDMPGGRYEKLLIEVCSKMKIDSNQIHLFYNNGFGTISGGCLNFPGKSVIGLPRNCSFNTVEDIRRAPILFEEKNINWDSKIGKALEDVLLISDEHVKFLIAHELVHIKDMHFIALTLHATGFCLAFYKAGMFAASLMKGSVPRIILAQLLIWGIGFITYTQTRQELSHWMEYKADGSAANLGHQYSVGGVDCMRSRLKLNRVLRKMHGIKGEKLFSKVGDNLITVSSHPKRTDRLKKIKEIEKSFHVSN